MITAGIDMGAKYVKVLLFSNGTVLARVQELAGFEPVAVGRRAFDKALEGAGISADQVDAVCATGAGRKVAPHATDSITEVGAAARGATYLYPDVRTVIDVGAEEGRAVKCNDAGKVQDFAVNEKCAAGAGSFTEAMARALEVPLEEFGQLSLQSTRTIPMNAQCAVFAESEVVSLVHAKTPTADIARAVHDAIASRIVSMIRRVGINDDVAPIGGIAYNPGFVDALGRGLETKVFVPEHPEYVGALGAAIIAGERSAS